jgi:hypothetical protein
MNGLKKAQIEVDRKVLADLAVFDKPAFAALAVQAKAQLAPRPDESQERRREPPFFRRTPS